MFHLHPANDFPLASVQFSSVAQSCLTLCDPMNHSTPGLPVHHQLPEFAQTHVHRVSDAIQPSHPLSPLLLLPSASSRLTLSPLLLRPQPLAISSCLLFSSALSIQPSHPLSPSPPPSASSHLTLCLPFFSTLSIQPSNPLSPLLLHPQHLLLNTEL